MDGQQLRNTLRVDAAGNPVRSNDANLFVFDPWKNLLPDVFTADELYAVDESGNGFGGAPTNFGDVQRLTGKPR